MDWVKAMEDYGQALKSVAVMLFALARLAERAALAPRPVRCFVLWIMRSAEAMAWRFIDDEAAIAAARRPAAPVVLWRGGGTAADAMRLARRLRALAGTARRLSARLRRRVRHLLARERARLAGLSPTPAARLPKAPSGLIEASLRLSGMPDGAPVGIDSS